MADEELSNEESARWLGLCRCARAPLDARGEARLGAALAAEALGAALLVALSCLPACAAPAPPPAHRALAAGGVVALLVQCLDQVSGAMFNPTVSLAAVVSRRLTPARGLAMLPAQLAGAAAGAALLAALLPAQPDHTALACCLTLPAPGYSHIKAALLEAVLGGCLALANCAAWDARNRGLADSWPLRVGAAVAALSLVAGELTGASMNPARSFGPALLAGDFTAHWVYWAGPLCGALLAAALYEALWRAPGAARSRGLPQPHACACDCEGALAPRALTPAPAPALAEPTKTHAC